MKKLFNNAFKIYKTCFKNKILLINIYEKKNK